MAKKPNYASMFTLRADGRYMGHWRELDSSGKPTGPRHAIYDRDPEKLFQKIQDKEKPHVRTVREVAEERKAIHQQDVKARTWANYVPHYKSIIDRYGDYPIADISAVEISQDLLDAKTEDYSYSVVNARRSIWRGIFDHAIYMRDVPYSPAASVKLPKGLKKGKRSAPEDEIMNEILDGANAAGFGFIPFFMLCTGLRRSEALQRKKADINLTKWEISIPKAKTPSGVRTVPIIDPLKEPLKKWMDAHPGAWLFPYIPYNGRSGDYMTDSNWETAWANFCSEHGWVDDAGKPTIGAHNLRHGTATLLYESGVDVYTAQHILGHANVTTTLEIYTELRKKHETKNVKKFSRSLSKMLSKSKKTA